jgi:hypothetical protein
MGYAAIGLSALMLAGVATPASAQPAKLKWTDNTDKNTIEAEYVRMAENAVVLKKDGKDVTVPLAKLNLSSHLQALKLAKPEAYSKPAPKAVVGLEQTAESTKLLAESPFTANQTIEQFLDTATAELEAGNFTVLWHALTPEMQADVEDVVVTAVDAGGKGMLVQIRALMKHLATVVHDKQTFIFAHPLAASNQQATREMQLAWPQVEIFTDAFTDKANWDSANFKPGNVGPWLAALTAKLGKASATMNAMAVKAGLPGSDLKKALAYKIVSQSGDSAIVQSLYAPPPVMNPQTRQMMQVKPSEPVEWVRVSGGWLPKDLVDHWKDGVSMTKTQLSGVMPGVSAGLAVAIPVVSSIANAQTQQEFNAAVQQILGSIPNLGGGAGGGAGMSGMSGGGASGMGMMAPPNVGPGGKPGQGAGGATSSPDL